MKEDPFMRQLQDLGDQWQIVSTKAGGLLPSVTVFEQSTHGDLVSNSYLGIVSPNGCFDKTHTDRLNWWTTHDFDSVIVWLLIYSIAITSKQVKNGSPMPNNSA